MNSQQQKMVSTILCYFSDLSLVSWLYYKATSYTLYAHSVQGRIDSLDFQFQLYRVLLQSLTFALLLFAVAQTVVYVLSWRNLRSALLYLKFFSVAGFAVALYIAFMHTLFALLPAVIYLWGYLTFAKRFNEVLPKMS